MDKLWAMQVFTRVVECGSFSRAAESLDIANATVTASVRNLETYLGVTLLSRNTRTLRLTDPGERFFRHCVELLRQVEEAEAEVMEQTGNIQGQLRIESPAAFGKDVIAPLLADFCRQHPDLQVALRLTDHPEGLIESGTDVAIRIDSVNDADLVARPLYQAHYVACATPSFLELAGTPQHPRELRAARCLGLFRKASFSPAVWSFSLDGEHHELLPEGPLHFNSTDALINAALADQGYIYVLDVFVNRLISEGKLVELLPQWSTYGRTFFSVTAKSRFVAPRTRAFIDYMMSSLDAQRRVPVGVRIGLQHGRQ
ncbi:transcriptional regulator [Pseudomonas sp. WN033]|nr:transcriptional regulator [Pseudomonas sp. WN033]